MCNLCSAPKPCYGYQDTALTFVLYNQGQGSPWEASQNLRNLQSLYWIAPGRAARVKPQIYSVASLCGLRKCLRLAQDDRSHARPRNGTNRPILSLVHRHLKNFFHVFKMPWNLPLSVFNIILYIERIPNTRWLKELGPNKHTALVCFCH